VLFFFCLLNFPPGYSQIQNLKGSKERYLLGQNTNMRIFCVIPFMNLMKLQKTLKQLLKGEKRDIELRHYLPLVELFCFRVQWLEELNQNSRTQHSSTKSR